MKQTHDENLAESFKTTIEKIHIVNETTKNLAEIVEKSDVEKRKTQIPAILNIIGTRSLRDTLAFMNRSKNFFKLVEKINEEMFWNKILIKPLGENTVDVRIVETDITPDVQKLFTNTKRTTKTLDNDEKETVFDTINNVGSYDMTHTKGLKSARLKDALKCLPKIIEKIRNPLLSLPSIENIEES